MLDRLNNEIAVTVLFAALSVPGVATALCAVPPSGMTSWWPIPLDKNLVPLYEGLTGTSDFIGTNDGILLGDAGYTNAGKVGTAFSFSGGYALIPNDLTLEPTMFTIDGWVRAASSPGQYRYLMAKGADGCEAASFGLYTGAQGGLQFYTYNGISYSLSPSVPAADVWDGEWHFFAATYDGKEIRLYLDGDQVGSPAIAVAVQYDLPDKDLSIGDYLGCSSLDLSFTGEIDEVELFERTLGP